MKFIDITQIEVRAGRGGDGMVSFASSKGKPKLGPDGGDGGVGGDVYLEGSGQLNTLNSLRFKQIFKGEDGAKGGSNNCRGKSGQDQIIKVPLGTVVVNLETNGAIGEVLTDGQRLLVAKGGLRGLGNIHWVTSTHQAPHESKPGGEGQQFHLRLELKVLADVGLAGFPNAGKSTLLKSMSAAQPKIADYPFTTLTPQLGVVSLDSIGTPFDEGFVIADIPGLIEGASEGKGLGHTFLKHLERTKLIVYVLDGFDEGCPPTEAYQILALELGNYSASLAAKPCLIAVNKIDLLNEDDLEQIKVDLHGFAIPIVTISGATGRGINELKSAIKAQLLEIAQDQEAAAIPGSGPKKSAAYNTDLQNDDLPTRTKTKKPADPDSNSPPDIAAEEAPSAEFTSVRYLLGNQP